MRLQMESQYWKSMCFVTLTYDDQNLPLHIVDGNLYFEESYLRNHPEYSSFSVPTHRPEHLCNFLKRLRKQLDCRIKYFAVGEYGTRFGRSHLHLLIFGLPYCAKTEKIVRKCWTYGFVKVTPAFPETCGYVAGYVQKKLYGNNKDFFRLPEFMRCSQHLGERWLYDHIDQFDDEHPFISMNGFQYGLPRQFRKILVKCGKLKESSLQSCVLQQKKEYLDLSKSLECKGTTMSEFFIVRRKNAVEKNKRKNSKRDTTGDI